MANIEFVQGQEQHSSSWGKFYVKGLEKYQVKEEFDENRKDNHHSYQGYTCLNVLEGTMFTIFAQSGDKRGTDDYRFYICVATDVCVEKKSGHGWCEGNFEIVAQGTTLTKAPRLMGWWINSPIKTHKFAQHCAAFIDKRGVKVLPPIRETTK